MLALRALRVLTACVLQAAALSASAQAPANAPPAAAAPAKAADAVAETAATIALILPGAGTPFARAAEAVRAGALAAQKAAGAGTALQIIEIDETPAQLAGALQSARARGAQLAIGALSRSLANAVGSGVVVSPLPLVTLNQPESDVALGPTALAFGVSIEQEARLVVATVLRALPPPAAPATAAGGPRFVVLVGDAALARRIGNAFRDALREAGERPMLIDVRITYDALQSVVDTVAQLQLETVFLALDAREAAAVRPRLPRALPLWATSQVNLGGAEATLLAPELDGLRFVDMPWLLQPDHAAVAVHARPEQPLSGELQRLYALGIDAYRLALARLGGAQQFELDGVTGQLRVDRARSARVQRTPVFAVFRNGRIEPLEGAR